MPRDNPLPFVFNRARQFFYPVLFHFQPANFLVQFDLNCFVLLIALGASCAKECSRLYLHLAFPLADFVSDALDTARLTH
jgi:hypothetical protein